MSVIDRAAKAIAAVEGPDIETLIEVATSRGVARVPVWQLYRVRARSALGAARDGILEAIEAELRREGEWVSVETLRQAFDQALLP